MQNDCIYCAGSARVQIKCRNYFNFLRSSRSVFLAPMLRFSLPGDILAPEVYFLTVKEQFFLGTFWHFVSIIITQVQNPYIVQYVNILLRKSSLSTDVDTEFGLSTVWDSAEQCPGQHWDTNSILFVDNLMTFKAKWGSRLPYSLIYSRFCYF